MAKLPNPTQRLISAKIYTCTFSVEFRAFRGHSFSLKGLQLEKHHRIGRRLHLLHPHPAVPRVLVPGLGMDETVHGGIRQGRRAGRYRR